MLIVAGVRSAWPAALAFLIAPMPKVALYEMLQRYGTLRARLRGASAASPPPPLPPTYIAYSGDGVLV